jgi:hypothetical protein
MYLDEVMVDCGVGMVVGCGVAEVEGRGGSSWVRPLMQEELGQEEY